MQGLSVIHSGGCTHCTTKDIGHKLTKLIGNSLSTGMRRAGGGGWGQGRVIRAQQNQMDGAKGNEPGVPVLGDAHQFTHQRLTDKDDSPLPLTAFRLASIISACLSPGITTLEKRWVMLRRCDVYLGSGTQGWLRWKRVCDVCKGTGKKPLISKRFGSIRIPGTVAPINIPTCSRCGKKMVLRGGGTRVVKGPPIGGKAAPFFPHLRQPTYRQVNVPAQWYCPHNHSNIRLGS